MFSLALRWYLQMSLIREVPLIGRINIIKRLVKKGATIGANATVVCGIEIGRFAFIGAGAVVTKSVADYALVMGNPAKTNRMDERIWTQTVIQQGRNSRLPGK